MQDHLKQIQDEVNSGDAQIYDVREQDEWDAGHLTCTTLVPLSKIQEGDLSGELNKDKKTYLHCRSGNRVYVAAPLLTDLGFENIVPMDEGFDELVDEGFERAQD